MKTVLLLSLCAVALCAPVVETENDETQDNVQDEEESRVKRAKEIMMFDNQQNEAKSEAKRADPNMDDSIASEDNDGIIYAREPVDISQQENSDDEKSSLMEPETATSDGDTFPATDTDFNDINESDENDEYEQISENEMNSRENDEDDLFTKDDYSSNQLLPSAQYQYQEIFNPYRFNQYRYKRSLLRALNGPQMQHSRVLKRNRRIKRNIYFPSDVYKSRIDPRHDNSVRIPVQYPLNEDDMSYLLNALDNQRKDDDEDTGDPYFTYSPYEDNDEVDDEPRLEYTPKRFKSLTYVPGIKRSREFYPYFEEPETHFSAFPEKRSMKGYAARVLELADTLRRQNNYYPEEYEEYRR